MPGTDFASATLITGFPFTESVNTSVDIYYKFVGPEGEDPGVGEIRPEQAIIGAFGLSTDYEPIPSVYRDVAGTPTLFIGSASTGSTVRNKPVQIPSIVGQLYYIRFTVNSGSSGGDIDVSVIKGPQEPLAAGNILVNDDTSGFPLIIASSTEDYTIINAVATFPAGEHADILEDGTSAWNASVGGDITVYNSDFTIKNVISPTEFTITSIRARNATDFYVAFQDGGGGDPVIRVINADGDFTTTQTLTGSPDIRAVAAYNSGAGIYYGLNTTGTPLKRWIFGFGEDDDLAPGISGSEIVDILVLADNSVIVLFVNLSNKSISVVHRYDPSSIDGIPTHVYPLTTSGSTPRLAYALDNPTSFWVRTFNTVAGGIDTFVNFQTLGDPEDGTILSSVNHVEYNSGVYEPSLAALDPDPRFGISNSCPFVIYNAGSEEPEETEIRVTQYVVEIATPHVEEPNGGGPEPGDFSGIYFINPNKSEWHDSYYNDIEKKIPDPTGKTGLIGE